MGRPAAGLAKRIRGGVSGEFELASLLTIQRPTGRHWQRAGASPRAAAGDFQEVAWASPPGEPQPVPPESHFPEAVVACHGVLAVATYVLVLLTSLKVGGS